MADKETTINGEDINNIQPQNDQDKNLEDKSNEAGKNEELDEGIKNIIEKYKTPEAIAKAKRETDKQMSKIQAEMKAKELLFEKYVKKMAGKDKNELFDLFNDDPEVANSVSKDLFGKTVNELDDINIDELTLVDDNGTEFIKKEDINKIIDIKLKKIMASQKSEELEKQNKNTIETQITSFKEEKGVEDEGFDTYLNELLPEGFKGDITKFLKAAYSAWYLDNIEDNEKVSKLKQTANDTMIGVNKKSNNKLGSYTQEDLDLAKKAGLKIEEYIDLKNKMVKNGSFIFSL